ncbi:MAG: DNA polymerase III subunit chi [Alphaproteobacteria bacterium]
MTEVSFYHLLHTPLDRALPKLIQKVLESGARAVIRTGSAERAEALSSVLWTFDQNSFLPHGTARDGNADRQPVWITPDDENPNGADILVLTDGATAGEITAWRRCLEMFDGRDDAAVAEARRRWSDYKAADHVLTYWQQTERGGWEKQG